MSTRAIRAVIEAYRKTGEPMAVRHPLVLAANEEVEAIEASAKPAHDALHENWHEVIKGVTAEEKKRLSEARVLLAAIARQEEGK